MPKWKNDEELFSLAKRDLFVALVGDVLDKMGFYHQFLSPELKPLSPGIVIIGRAMPVLEADVFSDRGAVNNPVMDKPFGLMFEALDDLKPGEIYICSGASPRYALWGGLMSTRAMQLGAAGAVVDGYSRDTTEIDNLQFPLASKGTYAQDQGPRGKVIDWRVSIEFDGVRINSGDMIYGDRDGVLVIPSGIVDEAFSGAIEKAKGENLVLRALESGMSATDAYKKFGIM
jgi:regulator of RNase E activity RraA